MITERGNTMIKIKNAMQKKHDHMKLNEAAHECAIELVNFINEIEEVQFDVKYIYLHTLNKMQESKNNYEFAKRKLKEKYTYSHWAKDSHSDMDQQLKRINNATNLNEYE